MGKSRPTVRTLPTGEKVTHYPDGQTVLHPAENGRALLDAAEARLLAAAEAADRRLMDNIAAKRDAMDAGDPVPPDKRPI